MSWNAHRDGNTGFTAHRCTHERVDHPHSAVAQYLCYAPGQAIWSHYVVSLIHLRTFGDLDEANRRWPDADYELMVYAIDPDGPRDPHDPGKMVPLLPMNVAYQFSLSGSRHPLDRLAGTPDEIAVRVADRIVLHALAGCLMFEPSGVREAREQWAKHLLGDPRVGRVE